MKKIFIYFANSYSLQHAFIYLLLFLPRNLASKITKDKDIRSNKNEFWAFVILFIFIIVLMYSFMSYAPLRISYRSGWKSLEQHYDFVNLGPYQKNDYTLTLLTKGSGESIRHHYSVKLRLDDTGFYFSSPSEYRHNQNYIRMPAFHLPLFIPWSAVTQCENSYDSKITLKIKNSKTLIQLRLWSFIKPMCQEKGIKIIDPTENKYTNAS